MIHLFKLIGWMIYFELFTYRDVFNLNSFFSQKKTQDYLVRKKQLILILPTSQDANFRQDFNR